MTNAVNRRPTYKQRLLLEVVNRTPSTAAQLAEMMWTTEEGHRYMMSRSTVSHALKRLERGGFVRRTYPPMAAGRQQVVWQITGEGERWAGLPA